MNYKQLTARFRDSLIQTLWTTWIVNLLPHVIGLLFALNWICIFQWRKSCIFILKAFLKYIPTFINCQSQTSTKHNVPFKQAICVVLLVSYIRPVFTVMDCNVYNKVWRHSTVSRGKSSGSKGKQHYKRTASETQTHNKWSHKIK